MNQDPNPSYIESVLNQYGVQKILRSGSGFTALCPFHEERNPSFSISDTGLWICHGCKSKGNIFQFHKALGGGKMDWKESLKALGNQLEGSPYIKPKKKSSGLISLPGDFKAYPNKEAVPPYISGRLKWETIQHFGLGSSDTFRNRGRCVIPIYYNDKPVGYHSRALTPDVEPKYYNPYGFDIKDHVFNYDSCVKGAPVIVVEGAFNAMSMWEKGFGKTLAVFGTQFTPMQIKKILDLSPKAVYICFDRDKSKIVKGVEQGHAGQKATKKLGELLYEFIPTMVVPLPTGLDPNDLEVPMISECIRRAVPYASIFGESGSSTTEAK